MQSQTAGHCSHPPRTYLLLDDLHIARQEGVEPVLGQPRKEPAPVLRPEMPWEGHGIHFGSGLLYDAEEKLFKLWYNAHDPNAYPELRFPYRQAYAVSTDCRHWARPSLGLTEWNGSCDNNLIRMPPVGGGGIIGGIVKDTRDPDPGRRYKAMDVSRRLRRDGEPEIRIRDNTLGNITCGLLLGWSADGLSWQVRDQWLFSVAEVMDATFLQGWDTRLHKWIIWARARVEDPQFGKYRTYGLILTEDLESLPFPKAVLVPDANDPPEMQFDHFRSIPVADGYVGLVTAMHTDPTDAYRMEIQLCTSRDLLDWKRPCNRRPFLPVGEPGTWDDMYIIVATPACVDDTVYILYTGQNLGNGTYRRVNGETRKFARGDKLPDGRLAEAAVGLATLPRDRWVSRQPVRKSGVLETKPLYFAHDKVAVNADASNGALRVELVDHLGRVIEGFSRQESDLITGDSLDHIVTWKGSADLSEVIGHSYRYPRVSRLLALRFYLDEAKLFAFSC